MKLSYRKITRRFDVLLAVGLLIAVGFICYSLFGRNALIPIGEPLTLETNESPQELADFLKQSSTDLNTASREELVQLPEIGETLAKRILLMREEIGRFTSWEQLLLVEGIGEKTIATLKTVSFLGP